MEELLLVDPRELQGERISFFPLFDKDIQDAIWSISSSLTVQSNLEKCLRAAALIKQYNIASASMYYESPATRQVCRNHRLLFSHHEGPFILAIKEEHNDFLEHAKEKRKLCPDSECYSKDKVRQHSAELQSDIGRAFHRGGGETSDHIEDAMLRDLSSEAKKDPHSLASMLAAIPSPKDRAKYEEILLNALQKRGKLQINRRYLERRLKGQLPQDLVTSIINRLQYHYLSATQKTSGIRKIDATIDAAPFQNVEGLSTQNFSLLMGLLDKLGIGSPVMNVSDEDLLELREREEVKNLMGMFRRLVNGAATFEENQEKVFWEIRKENRKMRFSGFVNFLKMAAPTILGESFANSLPPCANIPLQLGIAGSEAIILYVYKDRITLERGPLLEFQKVVLENYGRILEDTATRILETDDYSRTRIPSLSQNQALQMYLCSRRIC